MKSVPVPQKSDPLWTFPVPADGRILTEYVWLHFSEPWCKIHQTDFVHAFHKRHSYRYLTFGVSVSFPHVSNPGKGNLATKKSLRLHFPWRAGSVLFAAGSIAHGHFKLHNIDDFLCFALGTEQRVIKKSCIVVHLQSGFATTDGAANPAGFVLLVIRFCFH